MTHAAKEPTYVVGIDLGTTNCALAYAELSRAKKVGVSAVKSIDVLQLIGPGQVAALPMLPSSLYLPGKHDLSSEALVLPWGDVNSTREIVGKLALEQGSRVPGRLVTSAKSWLSYGGVDRQAPILPWGSQDTLEKLSPVEASTRYLSHLRAFWNQRFPDAPLESQDVVLTVPASFDDGARTLTLESARAAGLRDRLVLLEEPQAAFYAHFGQNEDSLKVAAKDQLILVVDVGGGTSDFTLISVRWADCDGQPIPEVERLAVGDHILLGGDNMDMALAYMAERKITGKTGGLDAAGMALLVQSCRRAKEAMLGDPELAPETMTVAIPGRGSKLIGGAKTCELSRTEVESAILDGFISEVTSDARPQVGQRAALALWGLPYASDPAITKHISAFLHRHGGESGFAYPDGVLLNGGVFKASRIRDRLMTVLGGWSTRNQSVPQLLLPDSLDLAVARGAATYGLVRHGVGRRIGGGAARAYFIAVAKKRKKSRGVERPGVCLLPRHAEPGVDVPMKGRVFNLVLGRPVRFSLYASTSERAEKTGELVDLDDADLVALPPLQTVLETREDLTELPVSLRAVSSEIGILEVWADSVDRDARYRLEFSLRDVAEPAGPEAGKTKAQAAPPADAIRPAVRAELEGLFQRTYGKANRGADPKEIRRLRQELERHLGRPREEWDMPELRAIWDMLKVGIRRRRRSERHEALFFHLTGYCLRPGFGDGFDEWRVGEIWKLYDAGINYIKDVHVWDAWWVMWRRIAGGLDETAQVRILDDLTPFLRPELASRNARKSRLQRPEEATRLVGALERVPVERKIDWGQWFLSGLVDGEKTGRPAWCLARLGARQPLYGSLHQVIPSSTAQEWVETLLQRDWERTKNVALAAATVARRTGDRALDLDEAVRERVALALESVPPLAHLALSVREVVVLERRDESRVFGDSLPEGLKLT